MFLMSCAGKRSLSNPVVSCSVVWFLLVLRAIVSRDAVLFARVFFLAQGACYCLPDPCQVALAPEGPTVMDDL